MRKINYLFIAGLTGLASCANNEYIGEGENPENVQSENGAILFSTRGAQATRGGDLVGATAAEKLHNNFVVAGYKGNTKSVVTGLVFDHYNVNWKENTAGTTASNTSDWEYVDQDWSKWNTKHTDVNGAKQTIKYWDYSTAQYDFIAFSTSDMNAENIVTNALEDGKLYVSAVTPSTASDATNGAYKVGGAVTELQKFYLADLVTVPNSEYGKEVTLKFRNITSKVRIGIYETVPGYAIKNVKFYANDTDKPYTITTITKPDLGTEVAGKYKCVDGRYYLCLEGEKADGNSDYYTITENTDAFKANAELYVVTEEESQKINTKGTYTVYYPTTNVNAGTEDHPDTDKNKAHVKFTSASEGTSTELLFGAALKYTNDRSAWTNEPAGTTYLGMTSNEATYVTTTPAKDYKAVLPNESATALTLRVNYELISEDGSKETIKVWGAKAVVPAEYCQWKSNYAYTYLFKISDNTNGNTSFVPNTPEGLFPITFDAIVMNYEDGIQETVTTVATPSITTYSNDPKIQPTANDEYLPGSTIYVQVAKTDGSNTVYGNLETANSWAYKVTSTAGTPISEATVIDALQMRTSGDATTIVGRNGIKLTPITIDNAVEAIPGVDGNEIIVNSGTTASFSTGDATAKIAYVYDFTGTPKTIDPIYSAVVGDGEIEAGADEYYEDPNGENVVLTGTKLTDGKTYYKKYTNNGHSYAVKVINVQ